MSHPHGTLTATVQSTIFDYTETGFTITIVKTCDDSVKDTYTPAIKSVHPTRTAYTLANAKQEPLGAGLCKITLTYFAPRETLPEKTFLEQDDVQEGDIQFHPDFASWSSEWDATNQRFKSTSEKVGITSWLVPSMSVTVTEYFSSKPSSPYGDIGKCSSPGTEYSGARHWLCVSATRQPVGNFWSVVKVFRYSAKEWNEDVYPD